MDEFPRNQSHLSSPATNSNRLHFHSHQHVTSKISTNYGTYSNNFVGNKTRKKTGYDNARNFMPSNRTTFLTSLFSNNKDTFQ